MNKSFILIFKSVLYRIYSSLITFLISFVVTDNVSVGFYIGLGDFIVKIFTYYVYEFIWDKSITKIINKKPKT